MPSSASPDPAELLELARAVALEAGALALQRRREGVEVAASKSSPEDIVTHADRETEALIRARLAVARPDDGFLGEESEAAGGSSGLTWVVDPIDGTVNFLYGIPAWAVSIAVVEGGTDPSTWNALAGCVVNPTSGETFTAMRGGGAFLNGVRLRANGAVDLASALIGTGFSYSAERRVEQARIVGHVVAVARDIRRIGAASLDLCNVAAGRIDAYYERGLKPWDHAAGALVASEAGARVSGAAGAAASGDLLIAAAPDLAAALESALADAGMSGLGGTAR
ncbi:inositol monophosphatase family protein [Planctomonas psychrotolerans]|uniref:inositol monophosphatase family protein n=1 Tax=Planctomonas psychrotolerans TaxID=2528712 RepID=UPI00123999AF|nr:inositol monophosphatase family protein [Planctomonas psychrotolerans]